MIIGIAGNKGSGKDTAGNFIRDHFLWSHSKKFQIKKYAGFLKQIVSGLLGCSLQDLEDREFKEKELGEEWWYVNTSEGKVPYKSLQNFSDNYEVVKMTPRKLLQQLGTEGGRESVHPNIWINALWANYKPSDNWVVTDVRFPNEVEAIKKRGGYIIVLDRPSEEDLDTHSSENSLKNYSFEGYDNHANIINSGTLEDFYLELDLVLTGWGFDTWG